MSELTLSDIDKQRDILHQVSIPVFAVDKRGVLVYANPQFYRLTELRPRDIVASSTLRSFLGPEMVELVMQCMETGLTVTRAEVKGKTPSGKELMAHVKAVPLLNGHGTVAGSLQFMLDMSVEKRLHEKYRGLLATERTDRMAAEILSQHLNMQLSDLERSSALGALAGGVAHEINNPLQIIRGQADLLGILLQSIETGAPIPEEKRDKILKKVGVIDECIARCQAVTDRLLTYLRSNKDLTLTAGDLEEVVTQAGRFFNFHPLSRFVKLDVEAPGFLPRIPMAPDLLVQLFLNLFLNACHAMEGRGDITVRIANGQSNDHVEVSIADTGCGIPAEVRDRLFDPFTTTKADGKGTGLGLFLVQYIVDQHRGRIEVDCPATGGTVFTIRLPKTERREES